jgi:hypothetical protein
MSKKLVDHLISINYRGIAEKIKSFRKPDIKSFKKPDYKPKTLMRR